MILGAIHGLLKRLEASPPCISFAVRKGPRNAPALDWLARMVGRVLADDDEVVTVDWRPADIADRMRSNSCADQLDGMMDRQAIRKIAAIRLHLSSGAVSDRAKIRRVMRSRSGTR